MGYAISLVVFAAGVFVVFVGAEVSVLGREITALGWILIAMGGIGIVLSVIWWPSWSSFGRPGDRRSRRRASGPTP